MKKLMTYSAILLMMTACGKDEPKQEQPQKPEVGQIEPSKPNESGKKEQNTPPINPGENQNPPATTNTKKPEDYDLRRYLAVEWRNKDIEASDFAYDRLNEESDSKGIFTTEYLAKYVRFVSSDRNANRYELTAEDLKDLAITDIKAEQSKITLKVKYKSIDKTEAISLRFDKILYYTKKLKVNTARLGSWYASGVAHQPAIYLTHILEYDSDRYAHEDLHAVANESDNSVTFSFKLVSKNGERELANITKTVEGFRPLSMLAQELVVASSSDLGTEFGKNYRHEQDLSKIKVRASQSIQSWIKKAQIGIGSVGSLHWDEDRSQPNSIRSVLQGNSSHIDNHHYYFVDPRFEVVSVRKQDHFLYLKLRLVAVNGQGLEVADLPQELMVHLIDPKGK